MTRTPNTPAASRPSVPRRAFAVIALVSIASWLLLWAVIDPNAMPGWARCPMLQLTGFLCPGCGSTRATHLLLNGRPLDALRHNPLAVVLGIPALVLLVVSSILILRGRADRLPQQSWIAWALLEVIVLFWIARNLPHEVFDAIRPPPAAIAEPAPD